MRRKTIRGTVVFKSKEEKEEFERYAARMGYKSFSQMVKCEVRKNMKSEKNPIEKSLNPLKDALDGQYKLILENNGCLERIRMQLAEKEENSEVIKAAREILPFILQREKSLSEINGKLSYYSQDVIDGAIALFVDLELIGTRRMSSEKQKNPGDIKNEKK